MGRRSYRLFGSTWLFYATFGGAPDHESARQRDATPHLRATRDPSAHSKANRFFRRQDPFSSLPCIPLGTKGFFSLGLVALCGLCVRLYPRNNRLSPEVRCLHNAAEHQITNRVLPS